ncbi:hypothetical protein UlMin_010430 [Ulmus minor]
MTQLRFLVVTFPAQGHINPGLQFAKHLTTIGAEVTFVTCLSAHRRMTKASAGPNSRITFAPFSNGYDEGVKPGDSIDHYISEIGRCGSQALSDLIVSAGKEGRPYNCLVYTIVLPWAGITADKLHLPSVLLWIQPAAVFDIYYHYFHDHGDLIRKIMSSKDPSSSITLPGLSLNFTNRDLPSFMFDDAGNTISFILISLLQEMFQDLDKKSNPKVLVNTFDELEVEALKAINNLSLIGIGPLIPSAFLNDKDSSDTSFGGDLFHGSQDCIEWLNTKPKGSVVYVSFGSISVLSKQQMEEMAKGLLSSGRPFLWVIREKHDAGDEEEKERDKLRCLEELEKLGKIVSWCSQVEVLSNTSVGCFVTHCGWNSTLESLASGVPMVAFPQWTDQMTNAKMIDDLWRTGVRVKADKEGIVEGEEIKRCLELVLGEEEGGKEMRRNAEKWRALAREATMEGGSSDKNLKAFVDEVIADGFVG